MPNMLNFPLFPPQVNAEDRDPEDQFGRVRYRIIGDDTAPKYFEIDETSGDIKLKESVEDDTLTEYQVL